MTEGIDINQTSESRKCIICHYWHFLEINFKIQPKVCNSCHDLMQKAMSFNDVAIVSVKGNDYREFVFCILEKLEMKYNEKF